MICQKYKKMHSCYSKSLTIILAVLNSIQKSTQAVTKDFLIFENTNTCLLLIIIKEIIEVPILKQNDGK